MAAAAEAVIVGAEVATPTERMPFGLARGIRR